MSTLSPITTKKTKILGLSSQYRYGLRVQSKLVGAISCEFATNLAVAIHKWNADWGAEWAGMMWSADFFLVIRTTMTFSDDFFFLFLSYLKQKSFSKLRMSWLSILIIAGQYWKSTQSGRRLSKKTNSESRNWRIQRRSPPHPRVWEHQQLKSSHVQPLHPNLLVRTQKTQTVAYWDPMCVRKVKKRQREKGTTMQWCRGSSTPKRS